jgi:hypothetical protein
MIEVYAFLAAFAVQILVISVLMPVQFTRRMREELANIPAGRLVEIYPGVDVGHAYARMLARYRVANAVVVVLGLLLLGWFFNRMKQPDWDGGALIVPLGAYFVLQNLPLLLVGWLVVRFNKLHARSAQEARRTATLQRRGVLDFVSPTTAVLVILSYAQFVVLNFHVARNPFPGYAGPWVNIGIVTFLYALFACVVYWAMYVRKKAPLETHAVRMRVTGTIVKSYAWSCILVPVFLSLEFVRKLLDTDLEQWSPFLVSVFFLMTSLLTRSLQKSSTVPRQPEAGVLSG